MTPPGHEDWCHIDMDCCGCTCDNIYARYTEETKPVPTFTIYVCGPMTGLPELNFPAFYDADEKLRKAGYAVLNPADRAGRTEGQPWSWYLRRGVRDVTEADGVALLPGWEKSRGARLEVQVADALDIPRVTVEGWLNIAPRIG